MLELELTAKPPIHDTSSVVVDEANDASSGSLTPAEIEAEARANYTQPRFSLRPIIDAIVELDIIEQVVEAMEGEISPEMEARQNAALARLSESADGMGDFRQAMQIEINARKTEEKRVALGRKALERRLERVEARFIEYCSRAKRFKIDGEFWTATIRTNPPSLEVKDQETVPAPYRSVQMVEEVTIDNKALKADLVAWEKAHAAWVAERELWAQRIEHWDAAVDGGPPAEPVEPKRPAPEKAAILTRSQSLLLK